LFIIYQGVVVRSPYFFEVIFMPSFPLRKSAADALLAKYEGIINKNSTIEIIDKVKIEL